MTLPFLGDAIAAGSSVAGGLIGASSARATNREMMRFQERMSGTAYQRAVADMKRAGLNPALMFGSGQGASTPSPQLSVPGELAGAGIAHAGKMLALELPAMRAQVKNVQKDIEVKDAQIGRIDAETGLISAQRLREWAQAGLDAANTALARVNTQRGEGRMPLDQAVGEIAQLIRDLLPRRTTPGERSDAGAAVGQWLRNAGGAAGRAPGAVKNWLLNRWWAPTPIGATERRQRAAVREVLRQRRVRALSSARSVHRLPVK